MTYEEEEQQILNELVSYGKRLILFGGAHSNPVSIQQKEIIRQLEAERAELIKGLSQSTAKADQLTASTAERQEAEIKLRALETVTATLNAQLEVIEEKHKNELANERNLHAEQVALAREAQKQSNQQEVFALRSENQELTSQRILLEQQYKQETKAKEQEFELRRMAEKEQEKKEIDSSWLSQFQKMTQEMIACKAQNDYLAQHSKTIAEQLAAQAEVIKEYQANEYKSAAIGKNGETNTLQYLEDYFANSDLKIDDTSHLESQGDITIISRKHGFRIWIDVKANSSKRLPAEKVEKMYSDLAQAKPDAAILFCETIIKSEEKVLDYERYGGIFICLVAGNGKFNHDLLRVAVQECLVECRLKKSITNIKYLSDSSSKSVQDLFGQLASHIYTLSSHCSTISEDTAACNKDLKEKWLETEEELKKASSDGDSIIPTQLIRDMLEGTRVKGMHRPKAKRKPRAQSLNTNKNRKKIKVEESE